MICPLMLAGFIAAPDYEVLPPHTPAEEQVRVCVCREEACAWWIRESQKCSVSVIGLVAALAQSSINLKIVTGSE